MVSEPAILEVDETFAAGVAELALTSVLLAVG